MRPKEERAPERYEESAGRWGRAAAELAREPDALGFALLMSEAAALGEAGELMHPELWGDWRAARDENFEIAASALSERELEKLEGARDPYGGNWAVAFGASPEKLRALAKRGLDPAKASCEVDGAMIRFGWQRLPRVEAAFYCCFKGQMEQLRGLREAGFAPPGAVRGLFNPPGAGEALGLTTGLIALGMLTGPDAAMSDPVQARLTLAWLASAEPGVRFEDEHGEDALKKAIRRGAARLAEALLDLGADPEARSAQDQDAFELFEEAREFGVAGIEALAPRMGAERERRELAIAAGQAPASDGAQKSRPRV